MNMKSITPSLVLFVLLLAGCQSIGMLTHKPKIPAASEKDPVVEMICLWEAAEGIGTDGMPTRGFAGQILFFTAGGKEPVKVEGDIRIYVFDDHAEALSSEPLHQFDFDNQSFQTFLHDTNLGGAYQLFVPYTRKGGQKATCSLRVRLTPSNGKPLYSKMASVILPGTSDHTPKQISKVIEQAPRTIEQMSHQIVVDQGHESATPGVQVKQSTVNRDRQALKSKLSNLTEFTEATPKHFVKEPAKPATDHPLFTE